LLRRRAAAVTQLGQNLQNLVTFRVKRGTQGVAVPVAYEGFARPGHLADGPAASLLKVSIVAE